MNKSLKEQIMEQMPEKMNDLRELGKRRACSDFEKMSSKIRNGRFIVYQEDRILVDNGEYDGPPPINKFEKECYEETIKQLFSKEGLEVEEIFPIGNLVKQTRIILKW